jgi:hypothetical protein
MSASEIEMILPFLRVDRRDRWREIFSKERGRKKLLSTLWNGDDLDRRLMVQIPPNEHTSDETFVRLNSLGAPRDCHLISARSTLDGLDLDLASALALLASGTIIVCMPGKLAYYESEEKNGRYIIANRS